jgi:hypothetical protein
MLPAVLIVFLIGLTEPLLGDDWTEQSGRGRWWHGDYKEEYWDGPCQVKIESKREWLGDAPVFMCCI